MGFSGRYHAASLVAVFVALAVGILIGIGLADDIVSSASKELETSLRSDLASSEDQREELESTVQRDEQFASLAIPALLAGRLSTEQVAIVAFGEVPDDSVTDVERAVEAAGGDLAAVARVTETPEIGALAGLVAPQAKGPQAKGPQAKGPQAKGSKAGGAKAPGPQGRDRPSDPIKARALGERVGAAIGSPAGPGEELKETLFDGFNGSLSGVERIVFLDVPPSDSDDEEEDGASGEVATALRSGIVAGVSERAGATVAAERTDTDPSTLIPYLEAGIATVDHLDLAAGKVSLVLALAGERGNYGIKEEATTFMPDLLDPDAGS